MDFCDLDLCEPSLAKLEAQLGFSAVHSLPSFSVSSQKDLSRPPTDFCAAQSFDLELLMSAVRKDSVLLVNPFLCKGFEKEHKLFRKMSEEGKALEIPLSYALACTGHRRAGLFHVTRRAVAVARKFGVPMVITSRASKPAECKSPQEAIAIATIFFGMTRDEAVAAVSKNPLRIASENGLSPLRTI